MDLMVGQMMAPPYNVSVEDLNSALRSIPVFAETIDALKLAHAAGASVCILSDANQHYIDVILAHHGLRSYVTEIVTNESYICLPMCQCSKCTATASTPRLHISPFQSEGEAHGCVLCPPNLCKGGVLEQWRARRGPACGPIVYVGDGGGDYCPATRLGEGDVVLCRANWALHKCIREQKAGLRTAARVVPWADGADLLSEFSSIFQHPR